MKRILADLANQLGIAEDFRTQTPLVFCDQCQNIFDNWDWYTQDVSHSSTPHFPCFYDAEGMNLNAGSGCPLCAQILGIIEYQGLQASLPFTVLFFKKSEASQATLEFRKNQWEGSSLKIKAFLNLKDNQITRPNRKLGMDDTHLLVKKWLDNCCQKHGACGKTYFKSGFLPTRLIDVRQSPPKLCFSGQIKGFPKYTTLSHCWGNSKSMTLSQANLYLWKIRIPSDALTQTFMDAIYVTRSLGIDYIWIDSLCIIQDKTSDDWKKESARMSGVYTNLYLNIAATSAIDGSRGLFSRDSRHYNSFFQTTAKGKNGAIRCHFVPENLYSLSIETSPLAQRGWVVQERILAPRTVHFTYTQVFWECNVAVACEGFPDALPNELRLSSDTFLTKRELSYLSWNAIVTQYSPATLTFGSDKLPAISGVAQFMATKSGCKYLAGLWGDDSLIIQLCWHCLGNKRTPRPLEYRAPSWTWSSIDCKVYLDGRSLKEVIGDSQFYASVIQAETILAGQDRFGAVKGGFLKLSCESIFPFDIQSNEPIQVQGSEYIHRYLWKIEALDLQATAVKVDINFDTSDREEKVLYLLPIIGEHPGSRGPQGLVLRSDHIIREKPSIPLMNLSSKKIHGQYLRVGHFSVKQPADEFYKALNRSQLKCGLGKDIWPLIKISRERLGTLSKYINPVRRLLATAIFLRL